MFHSRCANNRINTIHERPLRISYDDFMSSFAQLLEKDNSVTIHESNIQTLTVELYKVENGSATVIMKEVFPVKLNTQYPSKFPFQSKNVRTERYANGTLSYLGPKIWHLISDSIKNASLKEFKTKIKEWKVLNFPCRICKL